MAGLLDRRRLWVVPAGLGLAMGFALMPGSALAQKYEPPPPPLTVDPCAAHPNPNFPVTPDPKAKPPVCPPPGAAKPAQAAPSDGKPSASEQFPFPGGENATKPASAADKFPYPGSAPAATAPAADKPSGAAPTAPAKGGAGDQFPYPGETSKSPDAVPEGDTPRYVPDGQPPTTPSGSSSSSSSSSSSPDDSSSSSSSNDSTPVGDDDTRTAGDRDTPSAPSGRRKLAKVVAQSPDERVTEDLSVAKFYSDRGNFQAAYLRSKDATKMMPNDPEGHYSLAMAAQKLQRKDEAVAEYSLYLKLDPNGEKSAAAQRALTQLR